MTTGKGDKFAVALDRRGGISLVLARNGNPSLEDKAAVTDFMSAMVDPNVDDWRSLFPLLMKRCETKINRRIHKLHAAFSSKEFRSGVELAYQEPGYNPCEDGLLEFPPCIHKDHYPPYLQEYRKDSSMFFVTWGKLMENIDMQTANPQDVTSSTATYWGLCVTIRILTQSRFFNYLVDGHWLGNAFTYRLRRYLSDVTQYTRGINVLIMWAKRLFSGREIPFRWVADTSFEKNEGSFQLCENVRDSISQRLDALPSSSLDQLDDTYPSMAKNWSNNRLIQTCVHAEIRIIIHLGLLPYEARPSFQGIGMSSRSCACCTLWIDAYNRILDARWAMSRSHGKFRAHWALPGLTCEDAGVVDGRSCVDAELLVEISDQLLLSWHDIPVIKDYYENPYMLGAHPLMIELDF